MSAVLQFCIDESEEVDQELLDILLTPLLPSSKAENPAAYNLVGGVLRRVTGNIQANISSFVNHVLVGTAPSMREKASELSDHIYPLIYELHKISPGLLLRVLPNVCEQLKAEEEEVRLRAVKLLGRLFASTSAEYGAEFGRNFREFLNRFLDVSKAVREEMVDQCALVMKRKPDLRAAVEERMTERLRDAEFEVREGALKKLIEAGLDDPMSLSVATFAEMVERVKDKKETVHKTAIVGLAKIYGKFVACCLPDLSVLADNKETPLSAVRQEILDRLRTIPSTVCKYWGYPDLKNRHLVIHLLQEYLLPRLKGGKQSSNSPRSGSSQSQQVGVEQDGDDADIDTSRASALLLMFSLLEESERDIFGTILGFKHKVRGELQTFLEARKTATAGRATMQGDDMLKGSMMRLYKIVPIDKKVQPLEKLHQMKDKTIYKLLQHALEPTDNITEGITAREELKQRLDSKSQLSEYVCIVFDFSSYFVANEGALKALLKYAMAMEPNEALPVGQLLSSLAKHVPGIFSIAAADIEEWVGALATHASSGRGSSAAKSLLAICLKTIEVGGTGLAHDENSGSLCSALLQNALQHPDAATCEAFAKVASLLAHHTAAAAADSQDYGGAVGRLSVSQKKSESATVAAISNLASPKRLVMSNKRLHNDLLVLGALLRMPNRLGNSHAAKTAFAATVHATRKIREPVLSFIREDLFEEDYLLSKKDKEGEAARTQLLSAGLKVWAGLLSSEEEVKAMSSKEGKGGKEAMVTVHGGESIAGVSKDMNELIATLFECIDSDGHQIRGSKLGGHAASILYATAATSAMNLIKIKAIGDGLSVASWMKLAWTLLHPDTETRMRLAENLFDILQTCPVHSRFLTYPCLLAVDDRLHEHALRVIMFAVARLRRTHEILTQDAMADEDDEDAQRRAQDNMPETVLPFLLYLLSYHPEFPTSDVLKDAKDEKRLKHIVHIVRWTLRVLTESLGGEDSNLSFLIKQVNMISAYYDDTQDKDNVGLEYIMVLASKLLTELVKSDEHAVEYHGEIHLPMELYAPRPAARKVKKGSIETAGMDKVLSKDKKKGTASHHRPGGGGGGGGGGRKRVAEVEDHTDDEDDDEDKPKPKRAKKAATKKSPKAKAASTASEASKRDPGIERPRRQTTLAVSYREPTENDREVAEWEEQAAEKSNRSRTSIGSMSILGSLNSSSSSTSKKGSLRAAVFDEDDGEMDVESEELEEEEPAEDSRASAGTKRVSLNKKN